MYHRIVSKFDGENSDYFAVNKSDFRQHLKLLDALQFTPVTFEDYHLHLENKLSLPRKPIILTFDDGYRDNYENAFPMLQEFNMKAVMYVLGDRSIQYGRWDSTHKSKEYALMDDEQILHIRSEGFEIGAHSMTHAKLPELSLDAITREVTDSKHTIENLLGEEILSFSYPYGQVDERVRATVKQAGFKYACGVYTGPPSFGADIYDIRRLSINCKTRSLLYLLKILAPYEYAEWFYRKVRDSQKPSGPNSSSKQFPVIDYDFQSTNK